MVCDTPQDASTPEDGTMSCRRTPTSVGPSPTCWFSHQKKKLTDRSSVTEKKHESSVVSMLARAVQKKKKRVKKHTPFSLVKAQLKFCQQGQQSNTFAQLSNKKHFDHFPIEHKQISCEHVPFKSGPARFFCPPQHCNPRRSPGGSPFFHSGALRQVWPVCSSAPCPPLQRCQIVPPGASGRLGPHRCFSQHQETLRSMRHAWGLPISCIQPLCPACA